MARIRKTTSRSINPDQLTHNPLIGVLPKDSLNNVYAVLAVLRDYLSIEGLATTHSQQAHGAYLMMNCVMDALKFEIENS